MQPGLPDHTRARAEAAIWIGSEKQIKTGKASDRIEGGRTYLHLQTTEKAEIPPNKSIMKDWR
jgi:hypothetical protein